MQFLSNYSIAPHLIEPFLEIFKSEFLKLENSKADDEKVLKSNLKEVQKKIYSIEEEFYITKSMPAETYQKFLQKFNTEKDQIIKNLEQVVSTSSNHDELLSKALNFSLKLPSTWALANVNEKENLQKLIFPDGVTYSRKNGTFRTEKINEVFRCIANLNCITAENEKGQIGNETNLSSCVGRTRFELATPRPPAWCATGLRYRPINLCKSKRFI